MRTRNGQASMALRVDTVVQPPATVDLQASRSLDGGPTPLTLHLTVVK